MITDEDINVRHGPRCEPGDEEHSGRCDCAWKSTCGCLGMWDRIAFPCSEHADAALAAERDRVLAGHGPSECVSVADANRVLAEEREGFARARAAERERALAPVLALAKELARYPEVVPRDIARAIRRACGVQE